MSLLKKGGSDNSQIPKEKTPIKFIVSRAGLKRLGKALRLGADFKDIMDSPLIVTLRRLVGVFSFFVPEGANLGTLSFDDSGGRDCAFNS